VHACGLAGLSAALSSGGSGYVIDVVQRAGAAPSLQLDGIVQDALDFPLIDDGADHAVTLVWPGGGQ